MSLAWWSKWLSPRFRTVLRATRRPAPRCRPGFERLEERALLSSTPLGGHFTARYVSQVYQDLLQREADPEGLAYWTSALDQGASRGLVVEAVKSSDEYRALRVQEMFTEHLQRPADSVAVNGALAYLAHGGTLDQLEAFVLASDEYYQVQAGGTIDGYLESVYQDVLHRPVDASGAEYWTGVLEAGGPRAAVSGAVLASGEARGVAAAGLFTTLLQRPVEAASLTIAPEFTPDVLVTAIVSSEEYFQRIRGTGEGLARPEPFGSQAELEQYLIESAVRRWQGVFGQPVGIGPGGIVGGTEWQTSFPPVLLAGNTVATSAPSYSQTNVQEQGVDEADIVKTDGNYLYILSGQELVILRALPADELAVVSRTNLGGTPVAQYLHGDRLTVISQVYEQNPGQEYEVGILIWPPIHTTVKTKVTVFDLSDRTEPEVVQESTMDGFHVNSRALGSQVYVVVQNHLGILSAPEIISSDVGTFYESEQAYRTRLAGTVLQTALPQMHSTWNGGEHSGPLSEPGEIYRPVLPEDDSLITVAVFDAASNQGGPIGTASTLGAAATTVYASTEHLYVVTPHWSIDGGWTTVHQFHLAGADIDLGAVGEVPGQVINQFALDEQDGYLRIATTSDQNSEPSNNVYILGETDGVFNVVGRVEGLAVGERIFAVRFLEDRAFLVTFRQIDPLFALDLSEPTAPQVVGELHIPGFSRYLHPIDDTHLIGIGRDADPETGRPLSFQVSLFDVSDLANPQLVDREAIAPENWTWSEAEFDHHAVSYFPESGVLAVPVNGSHQEDASWTFTSDLWVFDVDLTGGFEVLGQIGHDSPMQRSLRINDLLYSVATDTVQVHPLRDPETLIGEVRYHTSEPPAVGLPGMLPVIAL